uniref:Protein kinase domain-containing protein n=1 Tax=Parastrongyloides trichosuri TaxID=131310 RepID=A0A0N4ZMF5_PARTI
MENSIVENEKIPMVHLSGNALENFICRPDEPLQFTFEPNKNSINGEFFVVAPSILNGKKIKTRRSAKATSKNGLKVIKDIIQELQEGLLSKNKNNYPEIYDYGLSGEAKCDIIIMTSVMHSMEEFSNIMSISSVLREVDMLLLEMLSAISYLHNCGFIHGQLNHNSFWFRCNGLTEEELMVDGELYKATVTLCDLDLVCRWNKNGYLDKLEKKDPELKKIYDMRLKKKNLNYSTCSLKQHLDGQKSMKGDFESWFYLCRNFIEEKCGSSESEKNEDVFFVDKQNLRKPTYNNYKRIGVIFADIINLIDKMNENDVPNYDLIKEKIELSKCYDYRITLENVNLKDEIEFTYFMELAVEYRRRKAKLGKQRISFDDTVIVSKNNTDLKTECKVVEEVVKEKTNNSQGMDKNGNKVSPVTTEQKTKKKKGQFFNSTKKLFGKLFN